MIVAIKMVGILTMQRDIYDGQKGCWDLIIRVHYLKRN